MCLKRVLNKISKQEYDERHPYRLLTASSAQNRGTPIDVCVYAKQLYLGPVPDSTDYRYNINYTTEAYTEVAVGTDPVPFTDKYRNIVRAGILAELYDGLGVLDGKWVLETGLYSRVRKN